MAGFENALVLILLLAALNIVGRRLPWPLPITYVVGSALLALWAPFPDIALDPGFFFLCFVPPLLFADGWLMPLRDFMAAKRPILMLATGLVVLTTVLVGLTAHWLVPGLSLAMGFALGAVVSPTDAVATAAITQKLKIPARLTTILNGESLMNDATGLVAFKFALAAAIAGTFSLKAAAMDFLVLAIGGILLGLAIAYAVGRIRDLLKKIHRTDPFIEVTASLLTPYAAYLAAEHFHLSSILAVVAAGLYSGFRDPLKMDAPTRQATWSVWAVVLFWLNGLAFILLGLQFPTLLASVAGQYSATQLALFIAAASAVAIAARLLWIFPGAYLPFLLSKRIRSTETRPPLSHVVVAGWAGMRGTITLAAALSIPHLAADGSPFPGRDIVIFLAFGVTAVTLLLQGTTLETLICKLGVKADDTSVREEHLARLTAVEAGLKTLRNLETLSPSPEETAALGEVIAEYEHRLAELTAQGETQASARLRRRSTRNYRLLALHAERAAIDHLWRHDRITDEIHRPLQSLLDHEESMLTGHTATAHS